MVAVDVDLAFFRRESWLSKAVGETLQENIAIVEM